MSGEDCIEDVSKLDRAALISLAARLKEETHSLERSLASIKQRNVALERECGELKAAISGS